MYGAPYGCSLPQVTRAPRCYVLSMLVAQLLHTDAFYGNPIAMYLLLWHQSFCTVASAKTLDVYIQFIYIVSPSHK